MNLARLGVGLSIGLVGFAGCDVLHTMHSDHTGQHGAAPSAPHTTLAPLAWIEEPTSAQVAAHLCPLLATDAPLSTAASAACRARGPSPALDAMHFRARASATIASSSMTRLTISSVLLVVTAYPDAGATQALGAVCLTLCDEGASACPQTSEACRSSEDHVLDLGDLDGASGFVTSIAVEEGRVADLAVRQLPAHGEVSLDVDLSIATERLLVAMRANDTAATDAIRAGEAPTFHVPYAIEGTLWVDGRGNDGFAEPIPRVTGTLELPAE